MKAPSRESVPDRAGGWSVERHGTVGSTQPIAATLPCWSAVIAERQTEGCGQWDRRFVSDPGGLYMTAVLPFDGDAVLWRGFALAVGWSILAHFHAEGVALLRLRWPNDLMLGHGKVGGILVTQGRADTLCVGVGLNVTNRPWLQDARLQGVAARLADASPGRGTDLEFLSALILRAVRLAHASFALDGLPGLVERLNRCWGPGRTVRLEMCAGSGPSELIGIFRGVLPNGDLLIEAGGKEPRAVRSHHIARLHELADVGLPALAAPIETVA